MTRLKDLVDAIVDGTTAVVPCNGCTACCRDNLILLLPEDDLDFLEHTIMVPPGMTEAGPVLKQKPNGDCHYLGPAGCTIHDRAPTVCRAFDCRGFYLMHSRRERNEKAAMSKHTRSIFAAAKARMPRELADEWRKLAVKPKP